MRAKPVLIEFARTRKAKACLLVAWPCPSLAADVQGQHTRERHILSRPFVNDALFSGLGVFSLTASKKPRKRVMRETFGDRIPRKAARRCRPTGACGGASERKRLIQPAWQKAGAIARLSKGRSSKFSLGACAANRAGETESIIPTPTCHNMGERKVVFAVLLPLASALNLRRAKNFEGISSV